MSTMQAFYEMLFSVHEEHDSYLLELASITQASPEQIQEFESDLGWQSWDV
jgi:hypothetical protein